MVLAASALAQEKPKKIPDIPPPGAMPARCRSPVPEHAVLKEQAGVWDATVESFMAPGQPPMLSKGVETGTMVGDFWLVSDFKTRDDGRSRSPGTARSATIPAKKKYVSTWVDSMTPSLSLGESDYDPATRTFTGGSTDSTTRASPTKIKAVTVWKDPATRVFTMSLKGPDGKEMTAMRITYTRQKVGASMLRIGAVLLAALALAAEGGSRMTEAADGRAGGLLLVANKGDHTLGIIDPVPGQAGGDGRARAASPGTRSSPPRTGAPPTCRSTATPAWASPAATGGPWT